MHLNLVKGLTEAEKKQLESQYKSNKKLLLAFKKAAEEKIEDSHKRSEIVAFMSDGENRDKYVAELGYRRGLREFLTYFPDEK